MELFRKWAESGDDAGLAILADRPLASEEAQPFLDAWRDLDSDRQWIAGMAGAVPRPIAWASIDAYARRHAIEGGDFDAFVSIIRAVDMAWMKELNLRRPKPDKAGPPKPPSR